MNNNEIDDIDDNIDDNIDNNSDVATVACLNCGIKFETLEPQTHNFCCEHCEKGWRDKYGEFVDDITSQP